MQRVQSNAINWVTVRRVLNLFEVRSRQPVITLMIYWYAMFLCICNFMNACSATDSLSFGPYVSWALHGSPGAWHVGWALEGNWRDKLASTTGLLEAYCSMHLLLHIEMLWLSVDCPTAFHRLYFTNCVVLYDWLFTCGDLGIYTSEGIRVLRGDTLATG